MSRTPLRSTIAVCILLAGSPVFAADSPAQLLESAEQRLHWNGLYLPEINITISEDHIATVSGTVATDIIKSEVVQTLQMTGGIRGVINRLTVAR